MQSAVASISYLRLQLRSLQESGSDCISIILAPDNCVLSYPNGFTNTHDQRGSCIGTVGRTISTYGSIHLLSERCPIVSSDARTHPGTICRTAHSCSSYCSSY